MILRLLLLLLVPVTSFSSGNVPLAEKGVLDLRNIDDPDHFIVRLNGDWEFYWMRMAHPFEFDSTEIRPEYYGHVPSYWTEYPGTEKTGYATYRLRVLFPRGFRNSLGIDMPVFDSAYDLYIDGRYIDGNGIPGKSADETTPEYRRVFQRIHPVSDTMEIIINVSNYHHRRGGFWLPARLGTFPEAQKSLAKSWAAEWSVISLLFSFSIFFFFFFLVFPREKMLGSFSLITLSLAIRPLVTSHFLIQNIFGLSWSTLVKIEYLGLFFILLGTAWYAKYIYHSTFADILSRICTIVSALAVLIILLTPVSIFSNLIYILFPALGISFFYFLLASFKKALGKSPLEIIYFLTFLLLFLGGIHDIMVATGRSETAGYVMGYVVIIFVFLQAGLMLYKWVVAFMRQEKLQNEMEYMNRNLEQLISERTKEIQQRNAEIEEQNSRIAAQNRELSDTIQLKNRIFSMIAHDLRSPVVNILYMLNLLKEKEYKEKYDTFANASIDYAQRVIGLLENMLLWGRGQEEKIKISAATHDLADLILTNLSIFKETADKKEISVNFTQVGSSVAWFDKDLMDIVIRNLLSNAVKYTHRKGRISIFLKDRKATGEGILLKICDNGIGIPEEKQKSLFSAEDILSTPGTENEKGTGLGLKLCNELVKLNNGNIEIESRVNEGTCFIITLPAGHGQQ